jgi:UDP-N-acetylmuramoyl-tripeptide--D-alanyl-D-alanine ligase
VRLEHRVDPDDPERPLDEWAVTEVELPLHGRYNVDNFLAAATTALVLGVPPEEIAAAVRGAEAPSLRGEIRRLPGGVTLVVDCYNSNPRALSRALESAAELPASRRWVVLGDMLELGPEAPDHHAAAGREAAELGFEPVAAVGELAAELASAAAGAGAVAHAFHDADEAAAWAADELEDGDLVLVKGSRGVGLEVVVEALETVRRGEE